MASYVVHNRRDAGIEDAVFVREGFSLSAAVLTVVWALWHRMWLVAALLLAVFVAIGVAADLTGIGAYMATALGLLLALWFGCEARNLQSWSLSAAGFREIGLSHGRDLVEAEIRFFHGRPGQQVTAAVTPVPAAPRNFTPDALGIFGNV